MTTNNTGSILNKNPYYFGIELGRDIETQIYLISQATKELLASQAASADEIVASKERVSDGLDYLSSSIDDVREGVYGLKSAFEIGISEVVWQIEKRRRDLQHILKLSMCYTDPQNKERRKQAENDYLNGLIDYSEEEFIFFEELNTYDFTIHMNLAMIYMFHKVDIEKSIYYFDSAVEYARQISTYYASFALLHKAILLQEGGVIDEARQCLEEAVQLSPDFCEPLYQLSILEASKNKNRAILLISNLLDIDIRYSLKIEYEPAFLTIRTEIHNKYRTIIDLKTEEIKSQYDNIIAEMNNISEQITKCNLIVENEDFKLNEELKLDIILQRTAELIDRQSLLDVYTAGIILNDEAIQLASELKESAEYYVDSRIKHFEGEKSEINGKYLKDKSGSLVYAMSKGIRATAIYSLTYIFVFFYFRNILAAIISASIPIIIIFSIFEHRKTEQLKLLNAVDDKLSKLIEVRNII